MTSEKLTREAILKLRNKMLSDFGIIEHLVSHPPKELHVRLSVSRLVEQSGKALDFALTSMAAAADTKLDLDSQLRQRYGRWFDDFTSALELPLGVNTTEEMLVRVRSLVAGESRADDVGTRRRRDAGQDARERAAAFLTTMVNSSERPAAAPLTFAAEYLLGNVTMDDWKSVLPDASGNGHDLKSATVGDAPSSPAVPAVTRTFIGFAENSLPPSETYPEFWDAIERGDDEALFDWFGKRPYWSFKQAIGPLGKTASGMSVADGIEGDDWRQAMEADAVGQSWRWALAAERVLARLVEEKRLCLSILFTGTADGHNAPPGPVIRYRRPKEDDRALGERDAHLLAVDQFWVAVAAPSAAAVVSFFATYGPRTVPCTGFATPGSLKAAAMLRWLVGGDGRLYWKRLGNSIEVGAQGKLTVGEPIRGDGPPPPFFNRPDLMGEGGES